MAIQRQFRAQSLVIKREKMWPHRNIFNGDLEAIQSQIQRDITQQIAFKITIQLCFVFDDDRKGDRGM